MARIAEVQAELASANERIALLEEQLAAAQSPAKVNRPRRKSTRFDTDLILACALVHGDSFAIAEAMGLPHEPAFRTRMSQLVNSGRLAEQYRPMASLERPAVEETSEPA